MKIKYFFAGLFTWLCCVCCSGGSTGKTNGERIDSTRFYTNPISTRSMGQSVFFHEGMYYSIEGWGPSIYLRKSDDLLKLKNREYKLVWTSDTPSMSNIDDAELFHYNGKWYIYFTGNDNNLDNRQIYVLENDSSDPLEGSFRMKGRVTTDKENHVAMYPSLFQQDGKLYMVWCGWPTRRMYEETQCIYIAEMENPWTLASERVLISEPEYEWECQWIGSDGNRTAYPIYVNEHPLVFRSHKQDKLLIYYSASGRWTPYYCEGLLVADVTTDPLSRSSWKKCPEPVFKQNAEECLYGPNIVNFLPSPDGTEYYYLYNVRKELHDMFISLGRYEVCLQKVEWDKEGLPILGQPQKQATLLRKPSGSRF